MEFLKNILTNILMNILMNFDFSVDFSLTYCLLTVASFRIGVPSILFMIETTLVILSAILGNSRTKYWKVFSQYFYPIVSSFPNPEEEDVVVTVVVSEMIPPPGPPSEPPTELEVFLTVFLIFFTLVLPVVSDMVVYNFIKPSEMITQSGGLGSLNRKVELSTLCRLRF